MHGTPTVLEAPGWCCFRGTKHRACCPRVFAPAVLCPECPPTLFVTYYTRAHLLRPRANVTFTEKHLTLSTLSQTLLRWHRVGTRGTSITELPVRLPHETGLWRAGLHVMDFHSQYLGQGQAQGDLTMNLLWGEAAQI